MKRKAEAAPLTDEAVVSMDSEASAGADAPEGPLASLEDMGVEALARLLMANCARGQLPFRMHAVRATKALLREVGAPVRAVLLPTGQSLLPRAACCPWAVVACSSGGE